MEPIKQSIRTIMQTPKAPKQQKRRRWIMSTIAVFSIMIIIGITAITSFYVGYKASQDNYKEAWVTYKDESIDVSITNKVVVTETEQDITDPGKARTIYDYERKQKVIQLLDGKPASDDEVCLCIVVEWNVTDSETTQQIRDLLTADMITPNVTFEERQHILTLNMEEVDLVTLSVRAREMCFGCKTIKANDEVDNATRAQVHPLPVQIQRDLTRGTD